MLTTFCWLLLCVSGIKAFRSNSLCGSALNGCPARDCDVDLDDRVISSCFFQCHSIAHIPDTCDVRTITISVTASCVTSVHQDKLSRYPHLTSLNLSCNFVTNITTGLFDNNPHLNEINLSHNKIREVGVGTFKGLSNLELNLANNELVALPNGVFNESCQLKNLFLDKNQLASVKPQWFGLNQTLIILSLSGNQIKTWPKLKALRNLEKLILSENHLSSWNETEELTKLWKLDLRGNRIEFIAKNAFTFNKNLRSIDLSENLLLSLDSNLFFGLRHLHNLNVHCNKLKVADPQWFCNVVGNIEGRISEYNTSIVTCDDNNWQCDVSNCKFKIFLDKLQSEDSEVKDKALWWKYFRIICKTPSDSKGMNLFHAINISECEASAKPPITTQQPQGSWTFVVVFISAPLILIIIYVLWKVYVRRSFRNPEKQENVSTSNSDPEDSDHQFPEVWDEAYVNTAPKPPRPPRPPPLPPRDEDEENGGYFNVRHKFIP